MLMKALEALPKLSQYPHISPSSSNAHSSSLRAPNAWTSSSSSLKLPKPLQLSHKLSKCSPLLFLYLSSPQSSPKVLPGHSLLSSLPMPTQALYALPMLGQALQAHPMLTQASQALTILPSILPLVLCCRMRLWSGMEVARLRHSRPRPQPGGSYIL